MAALIKAFEWKLGFNGEYWVPITVVHDNAAGTTNVTMGLYKNETLWDEVKDEASMRQSNILTRKEVYGLQGNVSDEDILTAVKNHTAPSGPHPGMGSGSAENFFADAVLI